MNTQLTQQHPFILASGSPQRKSLLQGLGIQLTQVSPNYHEHPNGNLSPELQVKQLAQEKFSQFISWTSESNHRSELVSQWDQAWKVTADTLVFFDHKPLGKPASEEEAGEFLTILSGKVHEVITGVYLENPESQGFHFAVVTQVEFQELSSQQIQWYLGTQEWNQAAGGYKIQGAGGALVNKIHGSVSNVIGLPLAEIYGILSRHNFWM